MKKLCYIVFEFGGGSYEYYDLPKKVFLSKEKADEFIKEMSSDNYLPKIDVNDYLKAMETSMVEFPDDIKTPVPELIVKTGKYPEWSLEDLRETEDFIQRQEYSHIGYYIEEVELCQ